MSQPNDFWQQFGDNVRASSGRTRRRLLRLIVSFGLAILLAPCCWVAKAVTGEPAAAMVVALVGIVGVIVIWRTMLWMFDCGASPAGAPGYSPSYAPSGFPQQPAAFATSAGQSPFGPLSAASGLPPAKPGFETPFPTQAGFVQPAYAAQLPGQPIMGASTGPVPPFAQEAPRTGTGAGCAVAALAVIGVLFLSCCGGGVAILATLPNLRMQVGPQQPAAAGPGLQPFGFPGPMPGGFPAGARPGEPFPNNDPFEDMRRAQEKTFQDLMKENERQMKEFDEQFRRQNEQAFGPGF